MFGRIFNRHRRLGLAPQPEPAPPIPPDAEPIPDGDAELEEIARLIEYAPPGGWAYTTTGLHKIVKGLQTLP